MVVSVRLINIFLVYFKDHTGSVVCLDRDSKRFVTGGSDGLIFVYDIKQGKRLGKLEGHKGGVRCMQLYNNRLCSGSWDMTLIIWSMRRFEAIVTLYYLNESVSCLYFDKNYL